jgi:hypothetical protein
MKVSSLFFFKYGLVLTNVCSDIPELYVELIGFEALYDQSYNYPVGCALEKNKFYECVITYTDGKFRKLRQVTVLWTA